MRECSYKDLSRSHQEQLVINQLIIIALVDNFADCMYKNVTEKVSNEVCNTKLNKAIEVFESLEPEEFEQIIENLDALAESWKKS